MASPESIVEAVERLFTAGDLEGVKVVISAGGTREPVDAVRVIANRSSGKQGYALAAEAAQRGADVEATLVDNPSRALSCLTFPKWLNISLCFNRNSKRRLACSAR